MEMERTITAKQRTEKNGGLAPLLPPPRSATLPCGVAIVPAGDRGGGGGIHLPQPPDLPLRQVHLAAGPRDGLRGRRGITWTSLPLGIGSFASQQGAGVDHLRLPQDGSIKGQVGVVQTPTSTVGVGVDPPPEPLDPPFIKTLPALVDGGPSAWDDPAPGVHSRGLAGITGTAAVHFHFRGCRRQNTEEVVPTAHR